MKVCVTADIERFSDGVSKYGCSHRIDDTLFIRNLLDAFCTADIPSTLFILGKFVHEEPFVLDIVKENGHELASHGYSHVDLRFVSLDLLEEELSMCSAAVPSKGFRAPYYGLNKEMATHVERHFLYDSSFVWVRTRKLTSYSICMLTESLMEIPLSTVWGLPLTSTNVRLLPLRIVKELVQIILKRNDYLIMNIHPWEFAKVPQTVAVPFYVKRNTGPSFLRKFGELLQFLRELEVEFVTMEQVYEYHRC